MASCVLDHEDAVVEETMSAVQVVDIRGNPIPSTAARRGGWQAASLILGAFGASNVAFAGIFLNLVLYFTDVWGLANAVAANTVTNIMGTMFIFAGVGAFVSDAYVGRYWATAIFLILYFLACAAFSGLVTATSQGKLQWVLLNLSLYLAAIGYGGFEPPFSALGGDQLNTPDEKGAFFNLFFVFSNVGQGVALVVLSSLEYLGMWTLGFSISAAAAGAGLLFLLSGTPTFRHYRVGGNPLARIAQVLVAAIKKTKFFRNERSSMHPKNICKDEITAQSLDIEHEGEILAHPLLHDNSMTSSGFQCVHADRFRWLDKATLKDRGSNSKWQTCTVTQVEEVKCLLSIFPIWVTCIIYNVTVAQLSTVFLEQGAVMGQPSWITIPPSTMQVFNIGTNIVFGIIHDVVVTRMRLTKAVTQLQRMGGGLVIALMAMVVAASVETVRLLLNAEGAQISIFWLAPQYVVVGISQVLMVVAQMDFFYSEVSSGMRSLGSCLPLLARAFGSYASTLIVDVVTSITTRDGGMGWIATDLNQGHLDYFYWTLAGVVALDFVAFLIFARSYKNLSNVKESQSCSDLA